MAGATGESWEGFVTGSKSRADVAGQQRLLFTVIVQVLGGSTGTPPVRSRANLLLSQGRVGHSDIMISADDVMH